MRTVYESGGIQPSCYQHQYRRYHVRHEQLQKEPYEWIEYQVEEGRARILFDRPEKRNALSYALLEEMNHACGRPTATSAYMRW